MTDRRELVFGFVAPLGVERETVERALCNVLRDEAHYSTEKVKITDKLAGFAEDPKAISESRDFLERKRLLMNAGDRLRRLWSEDNQKKQGDAAALLALIGIQEHRLEVRKRAGWTPANTDDRAPVLQDTAYLVDSFKHPDELQRMKRVYGPAFISIGLYAPPHHRKAYLQQQVGKQRDDEIDALIKRDEADPDKLGQRVAYAFYNADFIVDTTQHYDVIYKELKRLVALIFGDLFETPTRDELGMFLARAAQVRSASLARQIGAAIMRYEDGSLISIGTNEVPKPIVGGQYWPDDDKKFKGRDKDYKDRDTSDAFREQMADDVLRRLTEAGALTKDYTDMDSAARLKALYYDDNAPLRKALLRDNIDYVRAVHAEAAALLDAARHGTPTHGAYLFSTTFPCQECSRHIVAAGIREVVYLEPYPKSATPTLFKDSIQIDPPTNKRQNHLVVFRTFVGVAPARYLEFFTPERDRKDGEGKPEKFELETAAPSLPYYTAPAEDAQRIEYIELSDFRNFLKKTLKPTEGEKK